MIPTRYQVLFLGLVLLLGASQVQSPATMLQASDHDDGEIALKGRALNLTDVYVFREGEQTGVSADNDNLILAMCTHPRALARVQYYYSTNARYDIHVSRRGAATDTIDGADDLIFRFTFGEPDANRQQPMTIETIVDGETVATTTQNVGGGTIRTRAATFAGAGEPATVPSADMHDFMVDGETLTVFSGLREDPFFFDVEAFFRVRAALAGQGPAAAFRDPSEAVDFTAGYNVSAIVLRAPISFLQQGTTEDVFDVWATISVPQ